MVGNLGVAFDLEGVDLLSEKRVQFGKERLSFALLILGGTWMGVNQVELEPPQEEFLAKAGPRPLLLAGGFRDLSGILLGDRGS